MKTKGKILNEKHLEQVQVEKPAGLYRAPQVEVIDIELIQNILQASGGGGEGKLDDMDMPGEYW